MPLPQIIERYALRIADAASRYWPGPVPDIAKLQSCRIISHRGEHDNRRTIENTLPAFDKAAASGVWGLEMDVRWTRDQHPVVFHDADLHRIFGYRAQVATFSLLELKRQFPAIPSLAEVVARFGGKQHLMIEVKQQPWPSIQKQEAVLLRVLQPLKAIKNYHFLALQPNILNLFSQVPSQALIAVCDGWPQKVSQWVRQNSWGGVCGHYALISKAMVKRHHLADQFVGTGYIHSCNTLFRELNRGIDWIFSNHAVSLQKLLGVRKNKKS